MKESNKYHSKETDNEKQIALEESGITTFKERLLIAMKGQSGNSFAKKVGMSEAVIRDYLSGRTYPSLNRAAIIAHKCDISLEWLVTGKGTSNLLENKTPFINIPVFDIHVSNEFGEKAIALGLPPVAELPFDRGWISYRGFNPEDLKIFWAKGDSMHPTISNFDALVINTANQIPMDGYIYIIQYGNNLCVKRLQVRAKSLVLISDNSTYPSINIDNNDPDFRIIGRVVFILKDIN